MSNLVQNPIKTVNVNFPIDKVKQALEFVDKSSPNFTLKASNNILNSYKFGNRDGFSMIGEGNVVDVNLDTVEENKTSIQIEGSRLIGAINSTTENMSVKDGMDELLTLVSKLISSDNMERVSTELAESTKKTKSLFNYMGSVIKWTAIIGAGLFVVMIIAGMIINAING